MFVSYKAVWNNPVEAGATSVKCQWFVNDLPRGSEYTGTASAGFTSKTDSLDVNQGDRIQMRVKFINPDGETVNYSEPVIEPAPNPPSVPVITVTRNQ